MRIGFLSRALIIIGASHRGLFLKLTNGTTLAHLRLSLAHRGANLPQYQLQLKHWQVWGLSPRKIYTRGILRRWDVFWGHKPSCLSLVGLRLPRHSGSVKIGFEGGVVETCNSATKLAYIHHSNSFLRVCPKLCKFGAFSLTLTTQEKAGAS